MDATDIALEVEEQKKNPHFLDQHEAVKNPHGKISADSKQKLNRFLPSPEAQAKEADSLSRLLNTTTRAGAGGSKSGLVGIRPSGGKAASKFIDDFVGTGRFQKPKEAFSEKEFFSPTKEHHPKKPRVIIFDLCMDCMHPVSKDDAVPNLTFIPPTEMLNPIALAKWESVRVKPTDVIGYMFHSACVKAAVAQMRLLGKGIVTIENGQEVTAAQRYARIRSQQISDNVHSYLVNECLRGNSECYYDEYGELSRDV